MAEANHRLERMLQVLKDKGQRLTPQRLAILKILAQDDRHPGIEEIYEALHEDFPTSSLATVYKTIHLLEENREILELNFSGLGKRYDGYRPYPHPHAVCTACGRIMESGDLELDPLTTEVARRTGYRITHHQLNFYGLCPACQQAKK